MHSQDSLCQWSVTDETFKSRKNCAKGIDRHDCEITRHRRLFCTRGVLRTLHLDAVVVITRMSQRSFPSLFDIKDARMSAALRIDPVFGPVHRSEPKSDASGSG